MIYFKKFNFLIILIFILNSCIGLPGINKSPDKQKVNKKKDIKQYTIEDVGINIININQLSEDEINNFNKDNILEINNAVNNISEKRPKKQLAIPDLLKIFFAAY